MTHTIRNFSLAALLIMPLISLAAPNDTVATVNGKPIKQASLDLMVKQVTASGAKVDENSKRALLDVLINREVLAQEAVKVGVDKTPDFADRLEMQRQEMLANTYLRDNTKKVPTDEATLKAEYDKIKERMGKKEYNVRQIAVATEEEAKSIISQLSKGSDFATLAKDKSIDQATKDQGGSIGWVVPAVMRRPFDSIIASLPKGLYTTVPVQTAGGWVIVKVEDIRDRDAPAFDKVKDQLAQQLQQAQAEKVIVDLRAKAKITNTLKPDAAARK